MQIWIKYLINFPFGFFDYVWVDVVIARETPKAILVIFDNKKVWLPKAWIIKIKRDKGSNKTRIKLSEYHWTKKFG
ncbi:MAG: hypothetical protein KAS87_05920 [Candidatus Omnitrophica bacterium]|nr:hypothetical protein [Candidatus Omnitrophota bacterium]